MMLLVPDERYHAAYSLAAELQKRRVKIAVSSLSGSSDVRNLPYAAGYVVAYGLPSDEALEAIALNPAEMFGLGDSLASLDISAAAGEIIRRLNSGRADGTDSLRNFGAATG
ncbi:MAG TPA: hypothetical protein VIX90_09540 [Edaphobacter sp.]